MPLTSVVLDDIKSGNVYSRIALRLQYVGQEIKTVKCLLCCYRQSNCLANWSICVISILDTLASFLQQFFSQN